MAYTKLSEFLDEWEYESNSTVKLLSNLTDESLSVKVYNNGRTLGFLAWHLATTISEMCSKAGIIFSSTEKENEPPIFAEIIVSTYDKLSKSLIKSIKLNWTDASLNEEVEMYGEKWKRSVVLDTLVNHQIHHRGQITVLMRQAGLRVTGIYGPTKEEWQEMGLEPKK